MSTPFPPQENPASQPFGQPPYPTNPPSRPYPPSQPYPSAQPYPSQPYPPAQPNPSQPYPGSYTQPYPPLMPSPPWEEHPYFGSQPWPGSFATMASEPPQQTPFLAEPLPLWARLSLVGVVALFAVAAFMIGSDWAVGAAHVGWVLCAAGIIVVLATSVRAIGGLARATNPLRRRQLLGVGITAVILFALSGAFITLQSPEHRLQAFVLEKQGQFALAINEYQLAGEHAPGSHDLARVYDAWGERQAAAGQFAEATGNFDTVISTYPGASSEVKRAEADITAALLAWGDKAANGQDYANAVKHYDDLLNRAYCDDPCQTQASARDATAYYHLGETALATDNYGVAVSAFHALLNRFPAAPETQLIHEDMAKALLGQGELERSGATCSDALIDYKELIASYADTPEAKTGQQAMKEPEPVTGKFASQPPKGQFGVAILAKNLTASTPGDQFYNAIFSPSAPFAIVQDDGSFTFHPVKQGAWDLVWLTVNPATNQITSLSFYVWNNSGAAYYVAQVGPICPFDFGAISDPLFSPPTQSALGSGNALRTLAPLHGWQTALANAQWYVTKRLSGR